MTEKKTRREQQIETIELFLKTDFKVLALCLYGREIKILEKKYPILITVKSKQGRLKKCLVYKRKE